VEGTFGQIVVFVDGEAYRESMCVVVLDFVFLYGTTLGAAGVLADGGRGGEGVFYERGAGYEGDVVEVYYLCVY